MTKAENPFGAGYQEYVAGQFISWDKPGLTVNGILIDVKYKVPSTEYPDKLQTVYTLQLEDGREVRVARDCIDAAMKKVAIGQWVGLFYSEDVPAKKKGNKPFKLIKVYPGPMDPKFMANTNVDAFEKEMVS